MRAKEEQEHADVETELNRLKEILDGLFIKKKEYEDELGKIRNSIRSKKLPMKDYERACKRQNTIRTNIFELEKYELFPLKQEIKKWHQLEHELFLKKKDAVNQSLKIIDQLIVLRDKYLKFSEDQTRISSMRIMSSQIASEITQLLQAHQ